jgi:uncharacterized protein with PIN domain
MLGRLARYLRFLGHDTEYVQGQSDAEIRRRALAEGRRLLTRDRELAARTPGALLIASPRLDAQLRAVHRAYPEVPFEIRFDRCTQCNGTLAPSASAPEGLRVQGAVFQCRTCGHQYWDGSHTARIRHDVAAALAREGDA